MTPETFERSKQLLKEIKSLTNLRESISESVKLQFQNVRGFGQVMRFEDTKDEQLAQLVSGCKDDFLTRLDNLIGLKQKIFDKL